MQVPQKKPIEKMTLEEKTREYWKVCQSWHGTGPAIATGEILKKTHDIACFTDPGRPLMKYMLVIEEDIIVGKRSNRKTKQA